MTFATDMQRKKAEAILNVEYEKLKSDKYEYGNISLLAAMKRATESNLTSCEEIIT